MAKEKYDYFEAFCKQTAIAVQEADLLVDTVKNFSEDMDMRALLDRAHQLEHAGDEINHQTFNNVAIDFITPFEREDILILTQTLDGIIDSIEDVMQTFYMFDLRRLSGSVVELAETVQKSCVALDEAAHEFRNFKKPKRLHELIVAVNDLEEEGDRQYIKHMHDMFGAENPDPVRLLIWSTLFSRLEKCTDACEHASDAMAAVILKNS